MSACSAHPSGCAAIDSGLLLCIAVAAWRVPPSLFRDAAAYVLARSPHQRYSASLRLRGVAAAPAGRAWLAAADNALSTLAGGGAPHLHFGVYATGKGSVDPLPYICDAPCGKHQVEPARIWTNRRFSMNMTTAACRLQKATTSCSTTASAGCATG